MDPFTVVIPFRDGHATLPRLLDSLPRGVDVLIVDDLSDAAVGALGDQTRVLHLPKRGYFSGAVNAGASACTTDLLILNQDVWLEGTGWLELLSSYSAKGYSAIGETAGTHPSWPMGYVQGTFLWISRAAWEKVGPLDEARYPLWGATCEWQLRAARAGYKVLPVKPVPGLHHQRTEQRQAFGASIRAALRDEPDKTGLLLGTPPLVSVVIPAYNYARYLPDTIASLIGGKTVRGPHPGQTLSSFEVVIVDDASTDETPEVCKALADPWKGVRYLRREVRGGTPAANNSGIRESYGRYVTILCADDMRAPESLEAMVALAERNPHRVIYDDCLLFTKNNQGRVWKMQDYDFDTLLYKNQIHAGILFERAAWEAVGGYPEVMRDGREDWAFNVALGAAGYCGLRLPVPGYWYRREGQNRTQVNTTAEWQARFMGQMQALYPKLYAGERPMSCCGGKAKTARPANGASRAISLGAALPGSAGMVELIYLGGNVGSQSYRGSVTKTTYVFSAIQPRKWVDARDAEGLVGIINNRKHLFAYATAEAPKPAPAPIVPGPGPMPEPLTGNFTAGTMRLAESDDPHQSPLEVSEPEELPAEPEPVKAAAKRSRKKKAELNDHPAA